MILKIHWATLTTAGLLVIIAKPKARFQMVQNALINVSDLTVTFAEQKVLLDVSFSVEKGDIVIILGPNGAGKSTLLKALLNLLPYQGKIYRNKTKKVGYLPPQDTLLKKNLPPLTVQDFFAFKSARPEDQKLIFEELGPYHTSRQTICHPFHRAISANDAWVDAYRQAVSFAT